MHENIIARKHTYAGLFMVTMANLMYEILLTRIFSVTMWYHFAFMAISIALFGMTMGAILVYLLPSYFTEEKLHYHLSLSALLFAVMIVASFILHLNIPHAGFTESTSIRSLLFYFVNYLYISVPFIFGGINVCLALTRFTHETGRLYAADLAGAAVGCVALIYVLKITDGPTSVIVVALLACCGAALYSYRSAATIVRRTSYAIAFLCVCFVVANTFCVYMQRPLIRIKWAKGIPESQPRYEKWNSFSRIKVMGDPQEYRPIIAWGLSPVYPVDRQIRQLNLNIDSCAGTVLTAFDGNLNQLEHLKYDITNIAHYMRPNAQVFIIGTGGGRDILAALAFGQESVVGVEINNDIIETVNKRFGDFTGHLDRLPHVSFINDEARSYLSRQTDTYDIIQASLIDTWAATASGAFVLSENSIYTVEAWRLFLARLSSRGILTFSRFYDNDTPHEMYRLTALAAESLMQSGIQHPAEHMVIVKTPLRSKYYYNPGINVGTMLVSKEPFSHEDINGLERVAREMNYDMVLSPRFALDRTFAKISSGENLDGLYAAFPVNIAAPTDDSPFFFNMLRLRDIFRRQLWKQDVLDMNYKAVVVLGILLITVFILTLLCIIVPLLLSAKSVLTRSAVPHFIYFASIGLGFILIEISQMQRLIVFLGHPTYSLSVVLFSLLLSMGMGSYASQFIISTARLSRTMLLLMLLLGVMIVFGLITPAVIREFHAATTMVRILAAIGILAVLGFFMGMAFPIGMQVASVGMSALTPWLWGINGATSVCGSVIAIVIALTSGISTSFWIGFICYVCAFCSCWWSIKGGGKGGMAAMRG